MTTINADKTGYKINHFIYMQTVMEKLCCEFVT